MEQNSNKTTDLLKVKKKGHDLKEMGEIGYSVNLLIIAGERQCSLRCVVGRDS